MKIKLKPQYVCRNRFWLISRNNFWKLYASNGVQEYVNVMHLFLSISFLFSVPTHSHYISRSIHVCLKMIFLHLFLPLNELFVTHNCCSRFFFFFFLLFYILFFWSRESNMMWRDITCTKHINTSHKLHYNIVGFRWNICLLFFLNTKT